jgi:hypothetical protein
LIATSALGGVRVVICLENTPSGDGIRVRVVICLDRDFRSGWRPNHNTLYTSSGDGTRVRVVICLDRGFRSGLR